MIKLKQSATFRKWHTKLKDAKAKAMIAIRAGSGNLNSGDKWNFCLTLA
jgi:putative component of toxin-antitoxin plasmid stabilization module